MTSTRAWRPILSGSLARHASRAVDAIATVVGTLEERDPSLARGAAGLAVFLSFVNRVQSRGDFTHAALGFLRQAADVVEKVPLGPSLYRGFTGVAWASVQVESALFGAHSDSTKAVDDILKEHVSRPGWRGEYDLIGGLVGFGTYALERLPAPDATACLKGIIDRLEALSEQGPDGTTWRTSARLLPPPQRRQWPEGYYNLGLAHGVPGVIALLGAAYAAGVSRRKSRALLDGAVAWLLRQQRRGRSGSRFPALVAPGITPRSCRSAWCYGDPGVAAALLCAARSVGESGWEREAMAIARAAATRPPENTGVVDAGLCHGAAGLGHIFNRMYQTSGSATLRRAAQFWFRRTLAMRQPGRGVGGFSALDAKPDGTRFWNDDPGILTGAAGIALALLAATTSVEPAWDRMLLVSTTTGR